ncbi:MAG: putative Ig domain, partial [Actinomycetota bacterium]
MIRNILDSKARVAVSLLVSLAILITGVTPVHATHLRGAVGYIKYDATAKTITINSTMVERKDACPPATANTNLSSANGDAMPSGSLCTFFAFPGISAVDRTTGTVTKVSPCAGQATSPSSWYYNVTAEPLYNIFNTVYVINAACPNFNSNLDYIFSQTGSNRIGGIKNTTNQVIQFEGRIRLDQSRTTPIYNSGYMTNVAYIDPAVNPNYIYSTNLNALDEGGRAVTYSLITSSATGLGGYGATRIPCSDLNATTGEFRLGYKLCLAGENYVTSFSGGTPTAPINWALKTKATDANGQYVTRDVLLSFAGSTNAAPTISPTSQVLNVANGGSTTLTLQGRDADSGQTLSFSTNGLPSWATLTTNNTTNTAGNATLSINASGVADVAQVIQVSVTDSSAFQLSATATITVNIGSAVLPPNAPTISASGGQATTSLTVTFSPASSGGTPTSYSILATPVGGGTPITVSYTPSGSAPYTVSIPGAVAGTYYTLTVTGTNSMGSATSAPYNPVVPVTLSVSPTTLTFAPGVNSSPTLTYTSSTTGNTYTQSGLPAGLTFNASTGQISGTTNVTPGTYPVTITASNGGTVTVNVVVSKRSQTITAVNVGAVPYLTSTPSFSTGSVPNPIPSSWIPLSAYATSGLPVSYALSSSGSATYVNSSSSNGTSVSKSNTNNTPSYTCYLVVYSGVVYAMAAETNTSKLGATSCTIYVKQAGNSSYNAATALTSGSTTLSFKMYVAKFTTQGLAPKYMYYSGTTNYNATLPSVVYYVGDTVNHPFNLCPTTGTTTSATCTS